ncbi:MAG: DUF3800 domain-containing protein [Gemmataceae bacterium]|nr:DUF3800 domain-containing protein [Gemmataceae bacterium]
MYLMYADESGDCGLPTDKSPTRYFCLSGVVVHELRWRDTLTELLAFRRWIKHHYSVYLEDELHAAEMINKPSKTAKSIQSLKKHERLAIIRHFVDQLSRLNDISIINVVVDKHSGKLATKDEVFRGAWYRLFQRFENTIQYGNFPGPKNPAERGIVFPDRTDEKKLRTYLNQMRVRNRIKVLQPGGAFVFNDRPISALIEDPIVRESHQSYFIQAADCAVYLLKQYIEPSAYMRKHGGNAYFRRMEPVLCKVASLTNLLGIVRL